VNDLPDALLSDTKHLSQGRYRFSFVVTSADFSIPRASGGGAIGDRELGEFEAAIRDSHRERYGEQHLGE
jgi:hypothetical protein